MKSIAVLTSRESEIVRLIGNGWTSKEIANELYIDVKTVEKHRKNIIKKLNAKNMFEAIALYLFNSGFLTDFFHPSVRANTIHN